MQYIGRHPQEGLPLVESNTLSSASVLTQQNTFISKGDDTSSGGFGQSGKYHDMYLVEVVGMSSSGDSDAMKHKWIDNSGTDEDGTYNRSQWYHSPTTASSGVTTNNTNSSSVYGHNFGTGIGSASDDSADGTAWWTPFGYQKRTMHSECGLVREAENLVYIKRLALYGQKWVVDFLGGDLIILHFYWAEVMNLEEIRLILLLEAEPMPE